PASALPRLLRLWRAYAVMDAGLLLRNRRGFVSWYLSDLISPVASLTGTLLLAERVAGVGGVGRGQMLFMLGVGILAGGVPAIFFGYNVVFISRRLGRGQLDHTLIQPLPLWMSLLSEGFQPISASALVLPGAGLIAWSVSRLHLAITPAWLTLLSVNLLASAT